MNQECIVLTFRDVSQIRDASQLQAENRMLQIYNSCVSHELITPLKCLVTVSGQVSQ
jgi:hypothetical protein